MDTADLGPAAERLADLVTRVTDDELGQPAPRPAPAAMVGITAADELVVHGWDAAHATRQPHTCVPDLLDAARTFLALFASPDARPGLT
jgi:hypothetical protein